jgi:acyl-coenzyme A synthetase/AMP-(fatty) acid ligase
MILRFHVYSLFHKIQKGLNDATKTTFTSGSTGTPKWVYLNTDTATMMYKDLCK